MSLLMDALKKAEATKRRAAEGNTAAPVSEMSTPSVENAGPRSPLPDLAQHADSLDFNLDDLPPTPPAKRTAPHIGAAPVDNKREAAERLAAHNVFSAKQPPPSRTGIWIVLAVGSLAAIAIGGYFWWQLQPPPSGLVARPVTQQPVPSSRPAMAPTPLPMPSNATTTASAAPFAPPPSANLPTTLQTPPTEPTRPLDTLAPRVPKATAPASSAADAPLRLNKTQTMPQPLLDRAFDALQSGKLEEAQSDYARLLRDDPRNTDALLGLASIALRKEQPDQALSYFQKILESDPNDATAQAGIINLRGQNDPALAESRLKTALSSQPESGPLHFALGNLYARQQRWSEAQQAYFKAYASEGENPDYLYNLAVSLDHLHQNKLAAQYYQMAVITAENTPGVSFDRQQTRKRILELQP